MQYFGWKPQGLRGRVLVHSVGVAGCSWAIVGDELWEPFSDIRAETGLSDPARAIWVADVPDALGGERHFAHIPGGAPDDAVDLGAASFDLDAAPPAWTAAVRIGDPCFYIFTSGTTGLPKASIMTHMRWVKGGYAFGRAMLDQGPGDCIYAPLPLYHNQALTVAWASAAVSGAALATRRRFCASQFFEDWMREEGMVTARRQGTWVHYRIDPRLPGWAARIIECMHAELRRQPQFRQDAGQLKRSGKRPGGKSCD